MPKKPITKKVDPEDQVKSFRVAKKPAKKPAQQPAKKSAPAVRKKSIVVAPRELTYLELVCRKLQVTDLLFYHEYDDRTIVAIKPNGQKYRFTFEELEQ